ncbi:MAG: hypothetical protein B0D92_05295 [Spirochaeta sp. LUC14_002_19_P3]|nr:MAG: hypothetical protein B0D92_05295 [Spirochaeta sp. LUC14_002_19_P3]
MYQMYLLTVLTNVLAGLALSCSFISKKVEGVSPFVGFMMNVPFRVITGGLCILIAVINIFQTYPGEFIIIGNLLPIITGLLAGILLIVEFWSAHFGDSEASDTGVVKRIEKFSKPFLTVIGIVTFAVGVLHAIIPTATPF